jgi:esterase/lipase superfamily enzyme
MPLRFQVLVATLLLLFGCRKPETRVAEAPQPPATHRPVEEFPNRTPGRIDSTDMTPRAQAAPPPRSAEPSPKDSLEVFQVPIFYATNRSVVKRTRSVERYGSSLGNTLEFGEVVVNVPVRAHKVGEIERPMEVLGFRIQREDPRKHFVILAVVPEPFSVWTESAQSQVSDSPHKQALIYIHGFKNSFEDAAYRTAQLGVDLQIGKESLFMFSWPSRNTVTGYAADEETVRLCVADLNFFLTTVLDSTGAARVSVIAHSMGSRLLAAVLQEFKAHPPKHMPTEVVFAAPDINAEEFRRVIEPNIRGTTGRLTVYTSQRDQALRISKKEHGYLRLGEGGPSVFALNGFDKVDATDVDLDLIGHAYYAQTQRVLEDIKGLALSSLAPEKRKLARDGRFPRTWRVKTQ